MKDLKTSFNSSENQDVGQNQSKSSTFQHGLKVRMGTKPSELIGHWPEIMAKNFSNLDKVQKVQINEVE